MRSMLGVGIVALVALSADSKAAPFGEESKVLICRLLAPPGVDVEGLHDMLAKGLTDAGRTVIQPKAAVPRPANRPTGMHAMMQDNIAMAGAAGAGRGSKPAFFGRCPDEPVRELDLDRAAPILSELTRYGADRLLIVNLRPAARAVSIAAAVYDAEGKQLWYDESIRSRTAEKAVAKLATKLTD